MVVKINGLYSHVAWSDAPDGSVDFSLDEDDDASYIGHITSLSGEEITDPLRYTWTENTQQEEDENDSAEDDGLAEQVALNTTDNRGTQASSDTGIGNDNELYSTNAGTDGWKWDESKILAESVVIDPYDAGKPVNGIKLTAKSYPGKVLFECGSFVSKLEAIDASDIGSHAYTISLDVMMSSVFSVTSPSVISGDSTLLSFEDLEPDSMYEDIPMDGAWYHYTSTAQAIAEDAGDGGALCFDLSNMPSGSVLEIANLKLEAGANATPWKRSAAEAKEAADAAQSMATDAAKEATDYLMSINGGVLVAKEGNTVGALVSADGDFEVVPLTWADGKAEIGTALAKYDKDKILLGSTSQYPTIQLGDDVLKYGAEYADSAKTLYLSNGSNFGHSEITLVNKVDGTEYRVGMVTKANYGYAGVTAECKSGAGANASIFGADVYINGTPHINKTPTRTNPTTFTGTTYVDGFLTNASKGLRFTIPYCPAIYGTPTSITASMKIRQNGKYIYGSASTSNTVTIGSDSFSVSPLGVSVVYNLSKALSGATNNDLIAIDGSFTFKY